MRSAHWIINDAGTLGHYVTDGANPHHATIHLNGWAKGAANPHGYRTDNTFHRRFESDFVGARITLGDLLPLTPMPPRRLGDVRVEVMTYLRQSNSHVERPYQLDQGTRFTAKSNQATHKRFAVERLAAGANMLCAMWHAAWLKSGEAPAG